MRIVKAFVAIFFLLGLTAIFIPGTKQAYAGQVQAGPTPSAAAAQVEEILRGLEANYLRAEMEDDAALAGSILAGDFVGIKSDGSALDREQVVNNLAQHAHSREPYTIAAANLREHVFGDTACVTYTKIYTVPSSGLSYRESVLHIFTQRNGSWRLQVSSPIPGPSTR